MTSSHTRIDDILNTEETSSAEAANTDVEGKRKAESEPEKCQEYKRFKVIKEEDAHKWSLPEELAKYANEASEIRINNNLFLKKT